MRLECSIGLLRQAYMQEQAKQSQVRRDEKRQIRWPCNKYSFFRISAAKVGSLILQMLGASTRYDGPAVVAAARLRCDERYRNCATILLPERIPPEFREDLVVTFNKNKLNQKTVNLNRLLLPKP
jgi:hypothetical protein